MNFFTRFFAFTLVSLFAFSFAQAQSLPSIRVNLIWDDAPIQGQDGGQEFKIWRFEGASYNREQPALPYYVTRVLLPSHGSLAAKIIQTQSVSFDPMGVELQVDNTQPTIQVTYEQERNSFYAKIKIRPIFLSGGSYKKLESFTIQLDFQKKLVVSHRSNPTYHSKLETGDIYKFSISKTGIHRIDKAFLQSLGLNVSTINPKNIHLYGNGGHQVPELIATPRIDDLAENAIFISGQDDNSFDDGDYILFYGTGINNTIVTNNKYHVNTNFYSDETFYYLKVDDQPGIRITNQSSLPEAAYSTSQFLDCQKYELDKVNLLNEHFSTEGGGNEWYGELFKATKTQSFSDKLSFRHIVTDKKATMHVRFVGFSYSPLPFSMSVDGETFQTSFPPIDQGPWEDVGRPRSYTLPFFPQGEDPNISITYQANTVESKGWLDYIEITAYRQLIHDDSPLAFGTLSSEAHDQTTFRLTNSSNDPLIVWETTVLQSPKNQALVEVSNNLSFTTNTDIHKRFIAFSLTDDFHAPNAIGQVPNQNLHGIDHADAIFIYHPTLKSEALKLATHRMTHDNMAVVTVDVEDIYNEFSSGKLDPGAIRDFIKMVYDRDPNFKYLLLVGDGSFDHKNISNSSNNYNLIPIRETQRSIDKINTYPSDDFYALLSNDEGQANLSGALDIAVGRITAQTPEVANDIIEKIIFYDTSPTTLKPWRTRLIFAGDDDDSNGHMIQANGLADQTESAHGIFKAKKILFDAYPQVPAPYGDRIPEATKQFDDAILGGSLVANYFGHGGASGLAQERVLTLNSITRWKDIKSNLPLIITASCSTAGYDDPSFKTFGEELLKNPTGGAIALFSTTRPVYSSSNKLLIYATYPQIFIRDNGKKRKIGEILRVGKNNSNAIVDNTRKFSLLGDPTMTLALPDDNTIVTDSINGIALNTVDSVAIQALTKVTINGHIANTQQQLLTNFSGKIYVTIYDIRSTFQTLGQDTSPYSYTDRKGIIFRGIASVSAGLFHFSFVVPKDVVSHGYGRINYYASNEVDTDAAGYSDQIYIGGSGGQVIVDDTPPNVLLYMNDENFVSGGITNDHPTIFAKLSDDNGINISGSGIGHDLTATVDNDIKIANQYYEASLNDYTNGEIHYPLDNLEPGEHTISVKAWDVANNSGEATITFIVADDAEAALAHVLNYPNPFTDNTSFQFEHNLSGPIRARISIYSVDGKIIKTIDKDLFPKGFRVTDIAWNGRDEYGDQLAKGVYLYQVKLTSLDDSQQSTTSDFKKLVILK